MQRSVMALVMALSSWWAQAPARWHEARRREDGFSTAELLGNAALGIIALVVIWAALQAAGVNIVAWIEQKLLNGGGGGVGAGG